MIRLRPEEEEARRFLECLNLAVRPVPTGTSRTPEFLVDGDDPGYAVEVKARQDSEEWLRTIRRGEAAHQHRAMGYGRWGEDVAREAQKQFRSVDPDHNRWWILWLSVCCDGAGDAMRDEAIGSLFGIRQVVYYDEDIAREAMRDCLFARPGVFERQREIVGSIVSYGDGFAFCVNEFAPDYTSFTGSVVYRSFARHHAPATASELVGTSGFLQVADPSVDRKDDASLAAYLGATYGLKNPIMLDMRRYTVSVQVPRGRPNSAFHATRRRTPRA